MITQKLIALDACERAIEWAQGKSWQEIYTTCHRGDWLLWLFTRTNPEDLQLLTLAKGHCANTVRHLMKDERSIKAVDTAIAFGEGRATREELDAAAAAAYAAAIAYDAAAAAYDAAAYAAVADAAASAASADAAAYAVSAAYAAAIAYDAAAAAYDAAAYAADVAAADVAAAAAAADAHAAAHAAAAAVRSEFFKNLQLTADICRKYLPIEVWRMEDDCD